MSGIDREATVYYHFITIINADYVYSVKSESQSCEILFIYGLFSFLESSFLSIFYLLSKFYTQVEAFTTESVFLQQDLLPKRSKDAFDSR